MTWKDDTSEVAHARVARLNDYLDADDGKQELQDMLQTLKLRNSIYVQELNTLYEAYRPQTALEHKDSAIEHFSPSSAVYSHRTEYLKGFHNPATNTTPKTTKRAPEFTVPQPFHMTVREAEKREKKSTAWADPADARDEDDAECLKKFRAQPVPAHVFLPLYDEIVEQYEEKRKSGIQKRAELLVSTQQPFRFLSEERRRRAERPVTAPTQTKQSSGKTIPKSVLDPTVSDKLREAELLRKINSQIRAKDLLQSCSAPIANSRHIRDPHSRTSLTTKQRHLGYLDQNLTFQPRTNPSVPDFQALYRSFQKLSLKNQQVSEPTVTKPFLLRTSRLRDRKRHSRTEDKQDVLQDSQPMRYSSYLSSLSPNTLPVYITDTTKRRDVAIRTSLEERDNENTEQEKWLLKHRQKCLRMQKSLSRRAKALDQHTPLAEANKEKLRQNRQSERKRSQEYKEELQQMKRQVAVRPYLFERVTKGGASKNTGSQVTRRLQSTGRTQGNTDQDLMDNGWDEDTESL
ncbi:protein FAM161B [Pseudophryne corroboree]|uniref:protein FAM161B n=1 Tax=Pseudophryne corroboree TaxID=495146 RepID=UPI003081C58E